MEKDEFRGLSGKDLYFFDEMSRMPLDMWDKIAYVRPESKYAEEIFESYSYKTHLSQSAVLRHRYICQYQGKRHLELVK